MGYSFFLDIDINELQMNYKGKIGKDDNGKRKRKNFIFGLDFDIKKGKLIEIFIIFKKKRQNYLEFFNYDLELEREIKIMSRIGVVRKSVLEKKEEDFFEDEKQGKKVVDNGGYERVKII